MKQNPVQKTPSIKVVLAVILILVSVIFVNQLHNIQSWTPISFAPCIPRRKFINYIPSSWEKTWYENRAQFAAEDLAVCEALKRDRGKAEKWVSALAEGKEEPYQDSDVFSKFVYQDTCTGRGYVQYIEPFVGNFRHPYAIPDCMPAGPEPVAIEDRSYILTVGMNNSDFHTLYPGKKYFFDMGTATYPTSLGWFVPHFAQKGIAFDEIWAWEKKQYDPEVYWKAVPQSMQPKIHFYNIGVAVENSPLSIIKAIYKPGDFIAVKLDIDHAELELAILNEIHADKEAFYMISELFFEMHYDSIPMSPWFKDFPNQTYLATLEYMTGLRNDGIRMHYWP